MLAGIRRSSLSLFAAVALLTACGASRQPEAVSQEPPAPQYPAGVVAPNGRSYPQVPNAAEPLGLQLNRVEAELATLREMIAERQRWREQSPKAGAVRDPTGNGKTPR